MRALDRRELADKSFTCLPGCGFCCTFQPEVSVVELRGLRKALPYVQLSMHRDRTYLGLQGDGGACVLLKDRQCSAYEQRPAHCRFFPFHVYFGERAEVYVDLTCRGVVAAPGATLDKAFAESGAEAAALASPEAAEARKAHRLFREKATAEEVWQSPAGALARVVATADVLTEASTLETLAKAAGEPASADDLVASALEAWDGPVKARPFWLTGDLRWLTFERDGDGLGVLEMQEGGGLERHGRVDGLARHATPPAPLGDYARLLFGRHVFLGSAYARVDDHGYDFGVEEAIAARAGEIGADLALRARLVAALMPQATPLEVAHEVTRFYDADFLDSDTIGAFV